MKMNDYINDFTNHLTDAISIANNTTLTPCNKEIRNVLICGLGGSGIGGTIVADIVSPKVNIPIAATKDYSIPNFVNKHTLVIANSYSGNTEETLYALEKCQAKGAEIALRQSRYRRGSRRNTRMVRRRFGPALYRNGRRKPLFRQAPPANLRSRPPPPFGAGP